MIFRFNTAQLGRNLETKLNSLLKKYQGATETEIDVIALDFPYKFSVQAGDDVSVVVWDAESGDYKFVGVPVDSAETETIPESEKDTVDLPESKQKPQTEAPFDPAELAQRTYIQVNDFMKMSPEQMVVYNHVYNGLWSEHVKESK